MNEQWIKPPDGVSRGWHYAIEIKDLWDQSQESFTDESAQELALAIATRLRQKGVPEDVVDAFEEADTEDEVNAALDGLYDWGDAERVIIR